MDGLERLSLIGTGSFGKVYKCRDLNTGKYVAAKEINLDANEDCFDELRGEIVALLACSHPNIIRYHRSFIPNRSSRSALPHSPTLNRLFIVMDYCELGSLRQIIDRYGPLPEKIVAEIAESILSALEYLHRQRISHRDLKAANVMVDASGCIKLGDFGVALTDQSKLDKLAGSPYWMAPEVIKESRYPTATSKAQINPAAADIWSFGITLIELLKGRPPLHYLSPSAAMGMIPSTSPPRLESSDPHASKLLRDLIHACLHDDPLQRPTAAQLLKQFKGYFKAHKGHSSSSISAFLKKNSQVAATAAIEPEMGREKGGPATDKAAPVFQVNSVVDAAVDADGTDNNNNDDDDDGPSQLFSTVLSGWDFDIGSTICAGNEYFALTDDADPSQATSHAASHPATPKDAAAADFTAAVAAPLPLHARPTPSFSLRSVHSSDSPGGSRILAPPAASTLNRTLTSVNSINRSFASTCNWNQKDQSVLPIPPPINPPDLSRPQYEAVRLAAQANGREKQLLRLMRLYLTDEQRRPELSVQLRHLLLQ